MLLLAYSHRFAGVSLDSLAGSNTGFSRLIALAEALPDRPQSLRDMALGELSSETVQDITTAGTLNQAIEWLESLEGSLPTDVAPTSDIWKHFHGAPLETAARLCATLTSLTSGESITRIADLWGDFHHRTNWLARDLLNCVSIESRDEPDGRSVTLHLLAPTDDADFEERSVQVCRLVLDLCPEVDIVEVIVLNSSGERYSIGGIEPGYKRIPRPNLPRTPTTAGNAKFTQAGRLLLASSYWTEPIRLLAETSKQLLALRNDAIAWLINPHYNKGRRQKAVELTDSLTVSLAAGPREPVDDNDTSERKSAKDALNDAISIVRDIAASESPDDFEKRRLGILCRTAVKNLKKARQNDLPRLSTAGDPLPSALDDMLILLADVLLAFAESYPIPPGSRRRRQRESWEDVARRFVNAVEASGYQAEEEALTGALAATTVNCKGKNVSGRSTWDPHDCSRIGGLCS